MYASSTGIIATLVGLSEDSLVVMIAQRSRYSTRSYRRFRFKKEVTKIILCNGINIVYTDQDYSLFLDPISFYV